MKTWSNSEAGSWRLELNVQSRTLLTFFSFDDLGVGIRVRPNYIEAKVND
jgi:hypothetical protein